MPRNKKSYEPIGKKDLRELRKLAIEEHEDFFKRNPEYRSAFKKSLIGIFLCQGAASHYIDTSKGVNDFDIWHFYVEKEGEYFPHRVHKKLKRGYKGLHVDFLKRVVPKRISRKYPKDPDKVIMEYLLERNTKTKMELLKKGVIGLYPDKIFARIIWKGPE